MIVFCTICIVVTYVLRCWSPQYTAAQLWTKWRLSNEASMNLPFVRSFRWFPASYWVTTCSTYLACVSLDVTTLKRLNIRINSVDPPKHSIASASRVCRGRKVTLTISPEHYDTSKIEVSQVFCVWFEHIYLHIHCHSGFFYSLFGLFNTTSIFIMSLSILSTYLSMSNSLISKGTPCWLFQFLAIWSWSFVFISAQILLFLSVAVVHMSVAWFVSVSSFGAWWWW